MGDVLGIGCTHYPPGLVKSECKPWPLIHLLKNDKRIPERLRDPANWPAPMREQWGNDEGLTTHIADRKRMRAAFATLRAELDAFKPDLVVIWGDDQYENFREEIVPPFCVQAYDEIISQPFHHMNNRPNVWDEPTDKVFRFSGHREAGKYITRCALDAGIDMPYSYRPRESVGIGHAFANTLLFLDWDRRGFDYPVVPISVNAYGRFLISYRGGISRQDGTEDPPCPSPTRCFDMGRAVGKALRESPWRTVLIGSSSWSHAFLCEQNHWLYPDLDADHTLLEQLKTGDFGQWRNLTTDWIEKTGEGEFLSWISLSGAMAELGLKARIIDWIPTWIFNASQCYAVFS